MSFRFALRRCAPRKLEEVRNMFTYLACLPTEMPVALMHFRKAVIRLRIPGAEVAVLLQLHDGVPRFVFLVVDSVWDHAISVRLDIQPRIAGSGICHRGQRCPGAAAVNHPGPPRAPRYAGERVQHARVASQRFREQAAPPT